MRTYWRSLCGLMLLCAVALHAGGCGPMTFVVGAAPGDQELRAKVVRSEGGSDQVLIVDVSGLIHNSRRKGLLSQGDNPVALLQERLDKARSDSRVKAVILRINSPGGTVTASDAMYREVVRFKHQSGKPVVALLMDVAASGGYYLACAADQIVTYPTTVTGSVGVIFQTISVKPALARLGVNAEAITSGPNKDAGSPFSTLTAEHRQVFQALVDDFYRRFVAVVRNAREGIPEDQFSAMVDGRVISGEAAVKVGMADAMGDIYDAFVLAKKLARIKRANMVIYHRPLDYVGSVYAQAPAGADSGGTQINLAQINVSDTFAESAAGFYYLWLPEAALSQ